MKKYILISIGIVSFEMGFSQCPQPGLKFQTAACNNANDLSLDQITCSILKVKWQGDYDQKYVVKATGMYSLNNSTYDTKILNYTGDNEGNFEASISVKPGTNVSWSVQGKCIQENGILTDISASGPQAYIPICSGTSAETKTLKAYPNPTTGELMVQFDGAITPNTQLTISDVPGKYVVPVSAKSVTRTSDGFKMNVHNLANGTYFLKVTNAGETSKVKFVLLKN